MLDKYISRPFFFNWAEKREERRGDKPAARAGFELSARFYDIEGLWTKANE